MNLPDLSSVKYLQFIPQILALITDENQRVMEYAGILADLRAGKVPALITQFLEGQDNELGF